MLEKHLHLWTAYARHRQKRINASGYYQQSPHLGSRAAVYRKAVQHYNALWASRDAHEKHASVNDDPEFLNRIARNMLRHAFSNYELEISRLFGHTGREEGYCLLRERVDAAIVEKYPFLEEP